MKVAILAGGRGTRFARDDNRQPKCLATIGGMPIIWHIMRYYASFGFDDFVIAIGHRGNEIRDYFETNRLNGCCSADAGPKAVNGNGKPYPNEWNLQLIETGEFTPTGSRIKKLQPYLGKETFMLTWSDGVSNVDLKQLVAFHQSHGKLATVTAVRPPARFGQLTLDRDRVTAFHEKPPEESGWINGAYFVLEPGIFDYIEGEDSIWEREPLERLSRDGQLMAFRHPDFWQCMDTVYEQQRLEEYWQSGNPPWKIWK